MLIKRDSQSDDILSLSEAAKLLKVCEKTAHKLARAGILPGKQVGSQWRFSRRAVLAYIEGDVVPATTHFAKPNAPVSDVCHGM